jgi:hypothetical protein
LDFKFREEIQMSGKKVAVFGIYSNRAVVENATDSLVKAGFPTSDISVLLPESLGGPKEMKLWNGPVEKDISSTGEASVDSNKTNRYVSSKAASDKR